MDKFALIFSIKLFLLALVGFWKSNRLNYRQTKFDRFGF